MTIPKEWSLPELGEDLYLDNMRMPLILDWEVLGGCDRRCFFCWGPRHNVRRTLAIRDVFRFMLLAQLLGTRHLVCTGGEPLLDRELDQLLYDLHVHTGLTLTLSTSGVGLLERTMILESINDLGLGLDGPTPELNALMRPPAGRVDPHSNFWSVMELLHVLPVTHPHIELTLRTVACRRNAAWILQIPQTFKKLGIDVSRVRWKIYQLNTQVETHMSAGEMRSEQLSLGEFRKVIMAAKQAGAGVFGWVSSQPAYRSKDRYMLLSPSGEGRIIVPRRHQGLETIPVGSILQPELFIRNLNANYSDFLNEHSGFRINPWELW